MNPILFELDQTMLIRLISLNQVKETLYLRHRFSVKYFNFGISQYTSKLVDIAQPILKINTSIFDANICTQNIVGIWGSSSAFLVK